jgi:protein-tyrosine phosphatase
LIDLHCHLLPGIDDGSPDLQTSLAMARMAVADGIVTTACTPHIFPGRYDNSRQTIEWSVEALRTALAAEAIPLQLVVGADTHLVPGLLGRLRRGEVPTLAGSAYLLIEPAHHVIPPDFEQSVYDLLAAGYLPLITHPERLTWIGDYYDIFRRLVERGAWMQITSGSLTGRFSSGARYWGEKMLDEGLVHLLATDAHGLGKRPPCLAEGRFAAEKWVGADEARRLVIDRPQSIIDRLAPNSTPPPTAQRQGHGGWLRRLFGRSPPKPVIG